MKTFVVGDIHGGAKGLEQVLEKSKFDFSHDKLICLGDVYDGWPESAQAIDILMSIKNLVLILGNHDNYALKYLHLYKDNTRVSVNKKNRDHINWLNWGGLASVQSYKNKPDSYMQKHLDFFKNNYKVYHIENQKIFLHAGFDPYIDIDKQEVDMNYNDMGPNGENCIYFWDRNLWLNSLYFLFKKYAGLNISNVHGEKYQEIYVGHNPTILPPDKFEKFSSNIPMHIGKLWNMDTGASYHGKLSLMNIDTKELYQSDYLHKLYPGHEGRNGQILTKLNNLAI